MKALVSLVLLAWVLLSGTPAAAADPVAEHWLPIQRLAGNWIGTASGEGGNGTVRRRYSFVMKGRYLNEVNVSTYPPQEKNKTGEAHEHWGMFSFDKARKTLVLRHFHIEGFVNTFRRVEADAGAGPAVVVFESEAFENFSNSWKARETYEFLSDDEFTEAFELAPPGKPFQVYSRNHFKRVP